MKTPIPRSHILLKTAVLAGGLAFAGSALSAVYNLSRIPAIAPSGSGHTVLGECGGGVDDFAGAAAMLNIPPAVGAPKTIVLQNARKHTVYTVWVRTQWRDSLGNTHGRSPMTNGGATPLCPGTELDNLNLLSPWNNPTGSPTMCNAFKTGPTGTGFFNVTLNFPFDLTGGFTGPYPFSQATLPTFFAAPPYPDVPIPNMTDPGVNGPFTIRVVSHCQDGLAHGLSPGAREAWFQWP